jgi:hypothetical protein
VTGVSLGLSRVIYLALLGASFFACAFLAEPAEMGKFAIATAYAGIAVVALEFGVGRQVLVEVATVGPSRPLVRALVRWRAVAVAFILFGSAMTLAVAPSYLGAYVIVATRLAISDMEAVLIPTGNLGTVSIATLSNGVVTAAASLLAATQGHEALLYAAATGNIVGGIILAVAARRKSQSSRGRPNPGQEGISLRLSAVWPFGLMSIIGLIYLRSGIAILKPLGVSDAALASFAIASRGFDTVVAMRGALVQRLAVSLARVKDSNSLLTAFTKKLLIASVIAGIAGVFLSWVCQRAELLAQYPHLWLMTAIVAALCPAIMSHAATSAWLFSRPGNRRNVFLSAALAMASLFAVVVGVTRVGIVGVMFAMCVMELVSFWIFAKSFGHDFLFALRRSWLWLLACLAPSSLIYILRLAQ